MRLPVFCYSVKQCHIPSNNDHASPQHNDHLSQLVMRDNDKEQGRSVQTVRLMSKDCKRSHQVKKQRLNPASGHEAKNLSVTVYRNAWDSGQSANMQTSSLKAAMRSVADTGPSTGKGELETANVIKCRRCMTPHTAHIQMPCMTMLHIQRATSEQRLTVRMQYKTSVASEELHGCT